MSDDVVPVEGPQVVDGDALRQVLPQVVIDELTRQGRRRAGCLAADGRTVPAPKGISV
jgi:hypothetical protein